MTEGVDFSASNVITGVTLVFQAEMYQIMMTGASKSAINI